MDDPEDCCRFLHRGGAAVANLSFALNAVEFGICPPPGSSDEHVSLSHGPFHPGQLSAAALILLALPVGVGVLLYAAACLKKKASPVGNFNSVVQKVPFGLTYQAGLSPPGGFGPIPRSRYKLVRDRRQELDLNRGLDAVVFILLAPVFILLPQMSVGVLLEAAACFKNLFPELVLGILVIVGIFAAICLALATFTANVLVMCLALGTLTTGVTFQTALPPPGSFWAETKWEYSSYQLRHKHKKLALSKEESNEQQLAEARARKNQRDKLCGLLDADKPVRGRQVPWIFAHIWSILDLGHCYVVYVIIEMVNLYYLVHQDVRGSWKRSAYMVEYHFCIHYIISSDGCISCGSYRKIKPEDSRVAKHGGIIVVAKTAATWLVASAATHHATGNCSLLSGFKTVEDDLYIQAGDGVPRLVRGRGSVITDTMVLPDVWFVPGLAKNIVSSSQLIELDYSVGFTRGVCYIRGATDGTLIGKAPVGEDGMFQLEFLKVPLLNSNNIYIH